MAFLKKPLKWTALGQEPSELKKSEGFKMDESPAPGHFDFMFRSTYEAIEELQQKAGEVKTINNALPNTAGNISVTKSTVGLGNVDNTSDANKPISNATKAELDKKYTKPTAGIPKTDLESSVQMSLTKAEGALQIVGNIEIGGKNLIENTDFERGLNAGQIAWGNYDWTNREVQQMTIEEEVYSTLKRKKLVVTASKNSTSLSIYNDCLATNVAYRNHKYRLNQTYTLSLCVKSSRVTSLKMTVEGVYNSELKTLKADEWTHLTTTFTLSSLPANNRFPVGINLTDVLSGQKIEIKELQLERGTKSTSWSVAEEDLIYRNDTLKQKITTHQAEYEQHKSNNVSHDTYVTCATASATAEKVVTANGFTLVEGARITVKFANANTATVPTLKVNTELAKPLVKADGTAFKNIKAGVYSFVYSGLNFTVQGEGGEYGNVTAADVRSTKTFGTENGVVQGTLNLSQLIPSNIKKGVTIDGVGGSLDIVSLGGKQFASGQAYMGSGRILNVSNLTFTPSCVIVYADDITKSGSIRQGYGIDVIISAFSPTTVISGGSYGVYVNKTGATLSSVGFTYESSDIQPNILVNWLAFG